MTKKTAHRIRAFVPLAIPRLVVSGPVFVAAAAIVLFVAGIVMVTKLHVFDKVAILPGTLLILDKVTEVRAPHSAAIEKIFVSHGEVVRAGRLIVRLDNRALDVELVSLRKKAAATRAELATLQRQAKAALSRSRLGRFFSSADTAGMTTRIAEIDRAIDRLLRRIAVAEGKVARARIYAKTSGRVELIQGMSADTAVKSADVILTIVDSGDRLRVTARLPRGYAEQFSVGDAAKVMMTGSDARRYGPFDVALRSTTTQLENGGKPADTAGKTAIQAEFEFIEPRSQIAKQFGILSQLRTEIVIKSGEQNLLQLLFGAVL